MESKLSKNRIEELFVYVRGKRVPYIDVQYELVDHLATAIEEEMEQDEHLIFEAALQKVFRRFPYSGFSNFVEQKSKALKKYWLRRQLNYLKSYFTLPKILLTLLFFALSYSVLVGGNNLLALIYINVLLLVGATTYNPAQRHRLPEDIEVALYVLCIGFLVAMLVILPALSYFYVSISFMFLFVVIRLATRNRLWRKRELEQEYLVLAGSRNLLSTVGVTICYFLYTTVMLPSNFQRLNEAPITTIAIAMALTVALVFYHANLTHFPKMIQQELDEKYPHLNLKYQ